MLCSIVARRNGICVNFLPEDSAFFHRGELVLKVGQTSHLIISLPLQFPILILKLMEGLLPGLVALACQQLDKTEVRKWAFWGQEAKWPEEPICQLTSSWEWKKKYSTMWEIKDCSAPLLCCVLFSLPSLCFL